MRRAQSVLATGLLLGGLFAATAQSVSLPPQASVYQVKSNYVAGTVAPYNAGGGISAQSYIYNPVYNTTNNTCTLNWYGTYGWYTVLGATSALGPWTAVTNVYSTNFACQAVLSTTNSIYSFFQLNQSNSFAGSDQCASCHGDKYSGWQKTPHSYAIREHVNPDGSLIAGRTLACIVCHSVGDNQPTGYVFNTNVVPSNYTSPLANVGCEACHGPAGWHKNSDHDVIVPIASMDPAICGSCHQGATHPTFQEYTNTIASIYTTNFLSSVPIPGGIPFNGNYLIYGTNIPGSIISSLTTVGHSVGGHNQNGCTFCHNAYNRDLMINEYFDKQAGSPHALAYNFASSVPVWTATCVTCHDPHGSNYLAQLRFPTTSTNYFTMPTVTDTRTVIVTNYNGSFTTNTVYMNTVLDSLFNPKVQMCGQCHGGGRGARWDGTVYGLTTNNVVTNFVQTVITNLYTTVTNSQVFTNVTYSYVYTNGNYVTLLNTNITTNTYVYSYPTGQTNYTVAVTLTNSVIGVGVYYPLIAYTNGGVTYYTTNASGFSQPHYAEQYTVLIGQLDYDYQTAAGVPNVYNDPHELSPNQCVDCHVPTKYATAAHGNGTGHTFASDNSGCLTSCHSSYNNNLTGFLIKINNTKTFVTNGIARVVSLLNQWGTNTYTTPAILRTNYGWMSWEFPGVPRSETLGTVVAPFKAGPPAAYSPAADRTGTGPAGTNDNLQLNYIPQDIRIARFSLYSIYKDQSLGIHNPTYVKALLADAENRVANQFAAASFPAYFTGDILIGTNAVAPVTTTFTAPFASGTVNWNFGDPASGSNTASGSPAPHTFSTNGFYTVTCTVGTNSFTRTKYITVW